MTEQNKELVVNKETGEILQTVVVQDTEEFTIVKKPDGKYEKQMKYKRLYTLLPETPEEEKELFKIFNDNNHKSVVPMLSAVGKKIKVLHVFTNPYESFSEETGENVRGVTTTLYDGEKYYVTSSKSVYYSIFNMLNHFGYPSEDKYTPIEVEITSTRQQQGNQINISLV